MNKLITIIVLLVAATGFYLAFIYGRAYWHPLYLKVAGARTVSDVVAQFGDESRQRMTPYFKAAGVTYPPKSVSLLAVKDESLLELWDTSKSDPVFIRKYPIQALSGVAGPKLREGDRQVPEGIYQVEYLNPNSSYHLSMKLNYPNSFDLKHARAEGRDQPGTNIFIHGKAVSIGCLAMGDSVAEELFILASDIGQHNIEVAIAPSDPRTNSLKPIADLAWSKTLYKKLSDYFSDYKQ
ncbi:L,D-transpeptidase family protein [Kangiella sediminilitoris]|uniref:ErfK/YbiS/YcfS/YnhG family protein n=1 Tax=Kangiella sediminilitoris TaxID=1144748 RepID=A0A1B3BE06_9GAMM|nr:L,D-transpeptidase family protein [Kangiella sediminilitoris]AOE50937.1 ErfK/YbiS/YcfS/YnhG family protein [Kangiella sediminilitoris]